MVEEEELQVIKCAQCGKLVNDEDCVVYIIEDDVEYLCNEKCARLHLRLGETENEKN